MSPQLTYVYRLGSVLEVGYSAAFDKRALASVSMLFCLLLIYMSYCYLHGIVPISEGRRVQSTRSNGGTVWHTVYDSTIRTETESEVDGVVRIYAPSSEPVLPSDSLVLIDCKFAMPPNSDKDQPSEFIMDSINCRPFVANPDHENYDAFLPKTTIPCLNMVGTVSGGVVHLGDNGKAIDIRVSSFIHNRIVESFYRYDVSINVLLDLLY